MGFPAGLMLCAWGRAIGCFPIEQSVPIVFIGSALGSALGFAVSVLPVSGAVLALQVLLIPSFLLMLRARGCGEDAIASRGEGAPSSLDSGDEGLLERGVADMSAQASTLSMRILAGTCVYGLAAGLVEATLASSASSGRRPIRSSCCCSPCTAWLPFSFSAGPLGLDAQDSAYA